MTHLDVFVHNALEDHDGDAADALEDEIERRGLQEQYIRALEAEVLSRDPWEYIRAAPEARARAYLKATQQ